MLEFSVWSPNRIEKPVLCAHRWRVTTSIDIEPEVAQIVAMRRGTWIYPALRGWQITQVMGRDFVCWRESHRGVGRLHPCSCFVPHPNGNAGRVAHQIGSPRLKRRSRLMLASCSASSAVANGPALVGSQESKKYRRRRNSSVSGRSNQPLKTCHHHPSPSSCQNQPLASC